MLYYHSKRRTVRLFRRSDARMVANFCLSTEAEAFAVTDDGMRSMNKNKKMASLKKVFLLGL